MQLRLSSLILRCVVSAVIFLLTTLPCLALQQFSDYTSVQPKELLKRANEYLETKNDPDSALLCLTALTTIGKTTGAEEKDARIYAIAYGTMGAIYASVYGNYPEAAISFMYGLDLAKKSGLKSWKKRIEYNLIVLEYEQGTLNENIHTPEQTIKRFSVLFNELNPKTDVDLMLPLLLSATDISVRGHLQGVVKKMLASYPKRDALPVAIKDIGRANASFDAKLYDEAFARLEQIKRQIAKPNSVMGNFNAVSIDLIISHMMLSAGFEKRALARYHTIIENCYERNDLFPVYDIYRNLRHYFGKRGDTSKATYYELQELRVKDKLIGRSHTLSLKGARALYNEEMLKHRIVMESARAHAYRATLWITVVFLVALLALLSLLYYKLRQLNASKNIIALNDIDFFRNTTGPTIDATQGGNKENTSLFDKVADVVRTSQEIYEEDFSTTRLAQLAGDKPSAVSAAIFEATGATTSQFLARARIREACRRMTDVKNYGGYTIEAIGQSVGYRSRSHFGAVFKKIAGMSPSEYSAKVRRQLS